MSAHNVKNKSAPLLLFLLGALAFNLSSLPGAKSETAGTASLSSQLDTCDLQRKLSESDQPFAECNISDGKNRGLIRVDLKTVTTRDWSTYDGDPKNLAKVKTSSKPKYVVSLADMKTEGQDCEACKAATLPAPVEVDSAADLTSVAKHLFSETSEKVNHERDQARVRKEKEERCEMENGVELTDTDKILKCKIARVKKMTNREKAAEYFENEIKPDLQSMLSCDSATGAGLGNLGTFAGFGMNNAFFNKNCANQRAKAERLLGDLGKSSNPFIKQAVQDMAMFAWYNNQVQALNMQIAMLPMNDPRRKELVKQLQGMQTSWGSFYLREKGYVSMMSTPYGFGDFPFQSSLSTNLDQYNAAFSNIASQHAQYLQNTVDNSGNPVTPISSGQGRNARGMPSTSYGGAPGSSVSGVPNSRGLPFQQTRAGMPAAGQAARPLNGSSIIKPMMGQSVQRK